MKIINNTKWDTKDLRKLMMLILKKEGWADKGKELDVTINGRSRVWVGGRAYLGMVRTASSFGDFRYDVTMKIPTVKCYTELKKDNLDADIDLVKSYTRVFIHECGHAFDEIRHEEMVESRTIDVGYTEGMSIGIEPVKMKAVPTKEMVISKKKAKCESMLLQHQRKLDREKKLVKKWNRKVNYYDKQLAKAAGGVK